MAKRVEIPICWTAMIPPIISHMGPDSHLKPKIPSQVYSILPITRQEAFHGLIPLFFATVPFSLTATSPQNTPNILKYLKEEYSSFCGSAEPKFLPSVHRCPSPRPKAQLRQLGALRPLPRAPGGPGGCRCTAGVHKEQVRSH